MPIRNILIPIFRDIAFRNQLDAGLRLARRLEAHVNAVYMRSDVVHRSATAERAVSPGMAFERSDQDNLETEVQIHAEFEAWRAAKQLPCGMIDDLLRTPFACWSEKLGAIEDTVVRSGRLSDLIILNHPGPYNSITERAFNAALFHTGRPTIVLPSKIPDDLLRHVLVAWNGGLQATRAVASAMDLLHAAEHISIFNAPAEADDSRADLDLNEFLTWHGIRARCFAPRFGETLVGNAILRVATECEATLLVMGSFTQTHLRHLDEGGITSHVLQSAPIPVMLVH